MAKCYVAGPMTGHPEFNYPAFHAAADKLRAMGFEVVSPAELNPVEPDLQVDEDYHRKLYPSFMRRDIAALIECDHIVMLDGWEESKGASLEHHIALVLDITRIELE